MSALIHHLNDNMLSFDNRCIRKSQHFVILDGVLYRSNNSSQDARRLFVIPPRFRKEVLTSILDYPMAGHLRVFKTYGRIRRRYFLSPLYSFVYSMLHISCQAKDAKLQLLVAIFMRPRFGCFISP